MIHESEGHYVISSKGVWLPGCYESKRAARYAFRFHNKTLEALQDRANAANEDMSKRVITFGMLAQAASEKRSTTT